MLLLSASFRESKKENIASAGWSTLSLALSILPDEKINSKEVEKLLKRVKKEIHQAENRVRYTMNGFVISVGSYVPALTETAIKTATEIGIVLVNVGNTACKVPNAVEYIKKIESMDRIGKKRKTARC